MPRKQHDYHFIYKTTNLVNEKFYIGMHSTSNLEDGYIGSGKRLWYSIKKYGRENFKMEILEFLPDRNSLKEREKEIVNSELLKEELCMNLKEGGEGGFSSKEHQIRCNSMRNPDKLKSNCADLGKKHGKKNLQNYISIGIHNFNTFEGKTHSEKTKKTIGEKNSISQKGERNSQFGSCWITKDGDNKKIKITIIEEYILDGWRRGRTNKVSHGKK